MPKPLERDAVERLLRRLPLRAAPEGLWDRVVAQLREGAARPTVRLVERRWVRTGVAAAALLAALVGGSAAGFLWTYGVPARWDVQPLAGAPAINGANVRSRAALSAGEWLVTDASSRARLQVGRIGTAEVEPNSRVRLDHGGLLAHHLTLQQGTLRASISAPPRLFFVRTPTALATDLGCAYTLEVDSTGASRLHVTLGWVELRGDGRASVVPAGMVANVETGERPGTPYPATFSDSAREALERLDASRPNAGDLEVVLAALHPPRDMVVSRRQSAVTAWHLLQRVPAERRAEVYDRLSQLVPPPNGVTREGILRLDRLMLERWRRDLNPMWSDEAQWWGGRLARRFWDWMMR